jgi:hypothetical protein
MKKTKSDARTGRAGRPKKVLSAALEARRTDIQEDARRRIAVGEEVEALRFADEMLHTVSGALHLVEEKRRKRSLAPTRIAVATEPRLAAVRDALRELALEKLKAEAGPLEAAPPELKKAVDELSKPPAVDADALNIVNLALWAAMTLVKRELAGTIASEGYATDGKKKAIAQVLFEEGADDHEAALFMVGEGDDRRIRNLRRYISTWRREHRVGSGDETIPAGVREALGVDVEGLLRLMEADGVDPAVARGRLQRIRDEDDPLLDGLLHRWNRKRSSNRRR